MDFEYYKRYCKNIENVENFEKAKKDNFVGWCCHHRLQTWTSDGERRLIDIKAEELIALGMYYNRPASELIFLTNAEHTKLHFKGNSKSEEHKKKLAEAHKGKHHTEETKRKMSENHKGIQAGENNPMYGKKHTEEAKKKMAYLKKGKTLSEEHKRKMSNVKKDRHWYNNGQINKFCYECPEGFVPGRLKQK